MALQIAPEEDFEHIEIDRDMLPSPRVRFVSVLDYYGGRTPSIAAAGCNGEGRASRSAAAVAAGARKRDSPDTPLSEPSAKRPAKPAAKSLTAAEARCRQARKSKAAKEFVVGDILDAHTFDGIEKYLVHWKGYDNSWDTWEPKVNIPRGCKAVKGYLARCRRNGSLVGA